MKEPVNPEDLKRLCTDCGFCCSGVLFVDVKIRDKQELDRVSRCGVELEQHDEDHYLIQPCACLDESHHCKVYDKRPEMCASFECGVLKQFTTGELSLSQCLVTIRTAQGHVDAVTSTLLKLGNLDFDVPLFLRTEEVLSQPWDLNGSDSVLELRDKLFQQSANLSSYLETHFLNHLGGQT
jgi:Fe-S-cluster containining protein